MATFSNIFKIQDKVRCTEDIFSDIYKTTFKQNHEFWILGIEKKGLILEDKEGYLLKNVGFKRFEVIHPRGDHIDNNNSGWYSNRPN